MTLRVAGILFPLSLILAGCGTPDNAAQLPNTLRVELSNVAWAAYQDGDGSWRRLPEGAATSTLKASQIRTRAAEDNQSVRPRAHMSRMRKVLPSRGAARRLEPLQVQEHALTITDAQGRYGLAYVCLDDDLSYRYSDLNIRLSTLATNSDRTVRCYSSEDEPLYTLSGTVAGLGPNDVGSVYAFFDEITVDAFNTTYSFELWQDVYDVIATRYSGGATAPNRIIVQNDVSLETDQTLELDFESEAGFTPDTYTATLTDIPKGLSPSGSVTLASKNYTLASLGGVSEGTTFDFAFLPTERIGSEADIYTYAYGANDTGTSVSVSRYLLSPGDITLSLPEPLSGTSVSAVQGPTRYRYPTATWNAYPDEEVSYDLSYFQLPDSGPSPGMAVYLEQAWLGNATTHSYTVPDLSTVPGWNSAWNLKAGEAIYWYVGASLERNPTAESPDYIYAEQSGTAP